MNKDKFLKIESLDICYKTYGDKIDKPIILLSGLNTQMTHYSDSFCEKFSEKGFYVVKYDYRDVGKTVALEELKEYTLDKLVNDLRGLISELNLEKVTLFGRSMGGLISQLYASDTALNLDNLILIMTGTNNPELQKPTPKLLELMLGGFPKPNEDLEGYIIHKLDFAKEVHGDYYPFNEKLERELIIEDLKRSENRGGYKKQLNALLKTGDISKKSEKITTPTLIIHGDLDPMIGVDAALELHKIIKNSNLKILNGMGHDIPVELEDKIVDLVVDFCSKPKLTATKNKIK